MAECLIIWTSSKVVGRSETESPDNNNHLKIRLLGLLKEGEFLLKLHIDLIEKASKYDRCLNI